jgi:hypothetical protein
MAAAKMRKMDWLGYQTLAALIFFAWPPGWLGWAARLAVWAGRLTRSPGRLGWLAWAARLAAWTGQLSRTVPLGPHLARQAWLGCSATCLAGLNLPL